MYLNRALLAERETVHSLTTILEIFRRKKFRVGEILVYVYQETKTRMFTAASSIIIPSKQNKNTRNHSVPTDWVNNCGILFRRGIWKTYGHTHSEWILEKNVEWKNKVPKDYVKYDSILQNPQVSKTKVVVTYTYLAKLYFLKKSVKWCKYKARDRSYLRRWGRPHSRRPGFW